MLKMEHKQWHATVFADVYRYVVSLANLLARNSLLGELPYV